MANDTLSKLIEEFERRHYDDGEPRQAGDRKALAAFKAFRDWHQGEGGDISVRDAVCLAIQEAQ